jgi:hypothetical protein
VQLIVDYLSFYNVNASTIMLAQPKKAMQFGCALGQGAVVYQIQHANHWDGPVYMNKIDMSDSFYCVWLKAESAPKLEVVLSTQPGEATLLGAITLTLQMVWVKSAPALCIITEMVADLASGSYLVG